MITEVTGFFYSRQTGSYGDPGLFFFIIRLWLLSDDKSVLSASEKSVGGTWAGVPS